MLLFIDNFDSFTYNLVQYFSLLGQKVIVWQNNQYQHDFAKQINKLAPNYIVIGPGPCTPNEAGISLNVIREFAGKIPILGVCLGHQAIGQAFGASITNAPTVMHGRVSKIFHQNQGIFQNLPSGFLATRYHSLVIDHHHLPKCLTVTAWTFENDNKQRTIMGIAHRKLAVVGVQFHPESILSEQGLTMLQNFLTYYNLDN
ncbi:anthranilate/para-aminobenzoate synthase component II [Moraxella macacae 0408225]|uniref:Anthranilate/para-aminobenzoate synthase component II n=1 Tax=Moraxella macacae 0408225 TaxID=1230338 RepID=L2F898_9GAMM|nr:aminodeoxychorismate/anthranilate synthase component II [Moraxella macacae]ELA08688.1 anthranilate/para-aminobenzoate synthase component II [Moraxella macacae 0408225]